MLLLPKQVYSSDCPLNCGLTILHIRYNDWLNQIIIINDDKNDTCSPIISTKLELYIQKHFEIDFLIEGCFRLATQLNNLLVYTYRKSVTFIKDCQDAQKCNLFSGNEHYKFTMDRDCYDKILIKWDDESKWDDERDSLMGG